MRAFNPATGEPIRSYVSPDREGVESRLADAARAFTEWRAHSFSVRAARLTHAADILRKRVDDYAALMAREMGKPIAQGRKEIKKCAWLCDHYAAHGEAMLAQEVVQTDALKSYVCFQPLGVVLGIMPWNFPFWQVFRFAAPALLAGNTVAFKPAANVPSCATALAELFAAAGFKRGVFHALLVGSDRVPELINNSHVAAVTLTGSTEAGRAVAALAGAALKKSVLELGGSDPYLVLEDADLEVAADICISSRILNNGQSCIAAKRFIVVGDRAAEFEDIVVAKLRALTVGDPMHEDTDVGPLAREDLRNHLHAQVQQSIAAGATCLLGGAVPDGRGWWYPPTVLTKVVPGMPAYDQELFGPVAAVIRARTDLEAIRIANDSAFGLGACVITKDIERGEQIARYDLDAGNCFVNATVRSDARLPFGGIKQSGYGRELGAFGIREFVNIKTVYIHE